MEIHVVSVVVLLVLSNEVMARAFLISQDETQSSCMHQKFYRLTAQNVGHRSLLCNSEDHRNMQEGSPVDQNNRLIIIIIIIIINGVTIH